MEINMSRNIKWLLLNHILQDSNCFDKSREKRLAHVYKMEEREKEKRAQKEKL